MSRQTPPDVVLLTCPILSELFFDPVMSVPCGHLIESDAKDKLESPGRCPCCRESVLSWIPCPPIFKSMLESELKRALAFRDDAGNPVVTHNDIHFNMNQFVKIVNQKKVIDEKGKTLLEEGLKTPIGERYSELLANATNHLNDKAAEGTHAGKSPIAILASTQSGRDLLRKKLKIASGKYFFGIAEISVESLKIQVDGKSIEEWLNPTIELAMQEQAIRAKITAEQLSEFNKARYEFVRTARLFSHPRDNAEANYSPCDAVNDIMQQVVYGQRTKVREMLEQLKQDDPQLLKTVLTSVATTPIIDYSGKTIENMTLLQAAAAAGDVSLHPELIASDIKHQGMCEIIQSYFDANDKTEIDTQYAALFPNGFDACVQEQKHKAETFHLLELMLGAISQATPAELDMALSLNGARFDEQGDATRRKSFEQLLFTEKFNRFREVSAKRFLGESIFNPYYLLRALELYNTFCDRCERDASLDPTLNKRRLFWCQIIGFIQCFVPACVGQAFSQGLWYLVKVDQDSNWRPEALKDGFEFQHDRGYYFFPRARSCSHLGFNWAAAPPPTRRPGGGVDVGRGEAGRQFLQKLISSKNSCQSELMPHRRAHSHDQSDKRRCTMM
ncbi:MAG: hypothetical protein A3E82_07525 [Gammaproteobacteria bacterium RIFCSPHIGHO2_12_FULL_38_11]|nr:MAG: hypothetical protein A3E82_07525 [Gammaproteobacteria bacterium RIFCSPHIGHO2_12_FULL_38_11]